MNYSNGVSLLGAKYENFSSTGETLARVGPYPNHCRVLFPNTSHRIRLLFDGGVSLRNQHPITPDRTDLFQLLDAHNVSLPPGVVLGLADLGTKPAPQLPCEKSAWQVDGDNFVDICLDMTWYNLKPASVRVLCGEHTQLYAPKANNYPCRPHLVRVD